MKEEIRKQNGELSDAALEGVSGGGIETFIEVIQKACNKDCPAHSHPYDRSSYCAFEGTEAEREVSIYNYITLHGIAMFTFNRCPYFKR